LRRSPPNAISFEVIYAPGYSPGGIALYEAVTGVLFTGEAADRRHLPRHAADYLAPMEWLLRIPARIVHGGHFPSFNGQPYRQLITNWLEEKQKG
jgi:glyoxylase-like metal-dependent hydrolase (beta-lactamase superfamily II)